MKKRIGLIVIGAVLGFCLIHTACTAGQEVAVPKSDTAEKISVMILDGQMAYEGHKWAQTTPVMKALLESSGRFAVDVVTSPEKGKPNADFRPPFEKYDVIVANYEGDDWPAATQEAFVNYMQNGGGLVIVHAADNAFGKWTQWNEMIGFGGWGGRDEKSGPMIWWQDGKIVTDDSPGPGGAHGNRADWPITIRDPNHPITQGLPLTWMHGPDELYSKMRGPGKNMHVLATGRQSPDQQGTGRDEICLFTVDYGKGRVFHTTLGHDPEAMSCVGFIVTFQRGTEWAASGKVTLTQVPADFPTETKTSKRPLGAQTAEPK